MKKIQRWARTRAGKTTLGVVAVLVLIRLALPYIILHYANKNLAEMDGYRGEIQDISVSLFRGAYTIDSIYINKIEDKTGKEDAFFSAALIDLSVEWKALFSGRLVGEIVMERPYMKFTEDKVELDDVARDSGDFKQLLRDFMPVEVNRCEINSGTVMYADYRSKPAIELEATHINALAQNLRNTYQTDSLLPATLDGSARVHGGIAQLNMHLNPLAEHTDFDMDLKVIDAQLPQLNDFFKAYAWADVKEGVFSMYMESAAKDGKFVGYVKPFIRDLDVLEWNGQDKNDSFVHKIWEGVVGFGGKVLENKQKDDIAAKVPLSGSFEDGVQPNVIVSVVTVVQNAFFKSLKPALDYEINIANVLDDKEEEHKGFFKWLFARS